MTGDPRKAQEILHATLREAATRFSNGETPRDPFYLYRDARTRCIEAGEQGLQAEAVETEEADLSPEAVEQIKKLDVNQLAIWISGAPEPQRTALAMFYLGQFDHEDIMSLIEIRVGDLSRLLGKGRRQFQAWMNATLGHSDHTL